MATYNQLSPYSSTPQNSLYLELLQIRPVPSEPDDFLYTIENQYENRPDLLAYDVYGSARLWWVIVQRNLEILKDPIFDFVPGTKIYLPKENNLKQYLGI